MLKLLLVKQGSAMVCACLCLKLFLVKHGWAMVCACLCLSAAESYADCQCITFFIQLDVFIIHITATHNMARTKQAAYHRAASSADVLAARRLASRQRNRRISNPGIKKPHRYRPGTVALREIRKYQRSPDLLIRKAPFCRLVKEIIQQIAPGLRTQSFALLALQVSQSFLHACIVHGCILTI